MKASKLIVELQKAVADGRDWEVVSQDGVVSDEIVYHMPSLSEREIGAQPYITLGWPTERTS